MENKRSINLYDLFIKLIVILLISSIIHDYTEIIHLNDILVSFSLLVLIILLLNNLKGKDLIFIIGIVFFDFFCIINTSNNTLMFEHLIHINVALLLSYSLLKRKILDGCSNSIRNNERLIKNSIFISMIITTLTLLMPQFYSYSSGELIYNGLAGQHYLASGLCLCMVFLLSILKDKQLKPLYFLYMLIINITIFKTGARSFLIPIFLLDFIYIKRIKIKSIKPFIGLIIIVILALFFINSSGFTRFAGAASNKYVSQSKIEAMSSGRLVWWKYDLEAYKYSNYYNKLFGNGYELINYINKTRYGLNIWAHNDLIQILVSSGLYGILLYLYYLFKPKTILKKKSGSLVMLMWISYVFFELFLNGFYNYTCFVYSSFVLYIYLFQEDNRKEIKVK